MAYCQLNFAGTALLALPQIDSLIARQGVLLLDGGLATELERSGHDLNHDLWSARLLLTDPDAVQQVHRSYLEAGSKCIASASYQASIGGLVAEGLSVTQAEQVFADSVSLARKAVDEFWQRNDHAADDDRPIVAASIGPYGACLADGSEYRGNYGVGRNELTAFHSQRLELMCQAQPDLLAYETIPSLLEAEVLLELLQQTDDVMAWVSFSCRDGEHVSDGTPIQECARLFEHCPQVFAIGVNCTAPRFVNSLIRQLRSCETGKRLIVYPNSGQQYDAQRRVWTGVSNAADFGALAVEWFDAGATIIGGCCQTGPEHIRAIGDSICR